MDDLTSSQLSEWEAADQLDPIGKFRDDYNFAAQMALIMNVVSQLYTKKGHTVKLYNPIDFMPNWGGEEKPVQRQSVDQMKSILTQWAKDHNKRVKKRTNPPVSKDKKK